MTGSLVPKKKKTRPTRSRVVYTQQCTSSPALRHGVTLGRIRELMTAEVMRRKLPPEVPSHSNGGRCAKRSSRLAGRRVYQPERHVFTRSLDREPQVRVVGDDQGCLDVAAKYVQQQVRRHIDVAALFLPVGDRDHEPRVGDCRTRPVLNHDGPAGRDQSRSAIGLLHSKRGRLDACDIAAELDVIDASRRHQSLQVHVLVGIARRALGRVDPRSAVDHAYDLCGRPVCALVYERFGQRPDVKPPPAGRTAPTRRASTIVQIVTVHIHTDAHPGVPPFVGGNGHPGASRSTCPGRRRSAACAARGGDGSALAPAATRTAMEPSPAVIASIRWNENIGVDHPLQLYKKRRVASFDRAVLGSQVQYAKRL